MGDRQIQKVLRPPKQRHGPGLVTSHLGDPRLAELIDPFIVVSFYEMAGPTFPPHPHAGFSVATYILPDSPVGFVNQDTLGNRNRIAPGALHVTVAGRGVQHEEQPERTGSIARGYQIWIDHAEAARELAPHALHLRATDVPVIAANGAEIRVVLGESNGASSPLSLATPLRLVDVSLSANRNFNQSLDDGETAFLFMLGGALLLGGVRVEAGEVAIMEPRGDVVSVYAASSEGARFTLFAGRPFQHQRVQRGPFVANDPRQLQHFASCFQSGAFGTLTPFAAQPSWAPNDGQEIPS